MHAVSPTLSVGGLLSDMEKRVFFNGRPFWRVSADAATTTEGVADHLGGYRRSVDADSGAVKWTRDGNSEVVWETLPLWHV